MGPITTLRWALRPSLHDGEWAKLLLVTQDNPLRRATAVLLCLSLLAGSPGFQAGAFAQSSVPGAATRTPLPAFTPFIQLALQGVEPSRYTSASSVGLDIGSILVKHRSLDFSSPQGRAAARRISDSLDSLTDGPDAVARLTPRAREELVVSAIQDAAAKFRVMALSMARIAEGGELDGERLVMAQAQLEKVSELAGLFLAPEELARVTAAKRVIESRNEAVRSERVASRVQALARAWDTDVAWQQAFGHSAAAPRAGLAAAQVRPMASGASEAKASGPVSAVRNALALRRLEKLSSRAESRRTAAVKARERAAGAADEKTLRRAAGQALSGCREAVETAELHLSLKADARAAAAEAAWVQAELPVLAAAIQTANGRLGVERPEKGFQAIEQRLAAIEAAVAKAGSVPLPSLSEPAAKKPSAVAAALVKLQRWTTQRLPLWVLGAAPWLGAGSQRVLASAGDASWLGVVGFSLGALAGWRLAKELAKRLKIGGQAGVGGVMIVAAAGGGVTAASAALLAVWSPAAAVVLLSAAAFGALFLTRPHAAAGATQDALFQVVKAEGKHILLIHKEQFGKPYLLSATLEKGIGEKGLYSTWQWGEFLWHFELAGEHVQLTAKNTQFRAPKDSPLARTFANSLPDSAVAKAKILSMDPATGMVAVSLDELFLADLFGMQDLLQAGFEGPYAMDPDLSRVEEVKPFPKNVEVRSRLAFAGQPGHRDTLVPDPRHVSLTMRYSLSALPEGEYRPRRADDRLGNFTTVFQDWGQDQKRDLTVRFINRWKLEKTDPKAALSPVKEPIVYWIENTVPIEYRDAVKRGILVWNKAFERIGFKDAIVVRQQPDPAPKQAASPKTLWSTLARFVGGAATAAPDPEAEFDPADARFNVVRWFLNTDGETMAVGPSRANPFTGQLYNAGIAFHASMVRPGSLFDLSQGEPQYDSKTASAHRHDARCDRAQEAAERAATAWTLLEARGGFGPEERKRFIEEYIIETIAHEFGHNLGERHVFNASTWRSAQELASAAPGGISASFMDYNPPNLAAPGEKQGAFFQTDLGPYDYWWVEHTYRTFDGLTEEQERAELEKIASRAGEPGLVYATDEDVTGMDPDVQRWDLGSDNLEFAERRIVLVRELWQRLAEHEPPAGQGWQPVRRAFDRGYGEFHWAVEAVLPNIGGVHFHREHAGNKEGKLPYEPVSAERQRLTVQFLFEHVFLDDDFAVPAELLRKLAPERLPTLADPYPWLAAPLYTEKVMAIRRAALDHVFDPETLERLVDSRTLHAVASDVFTVGELFERLTTAVWIELYFKKRPRLAGIGPLRRHLQQEYVDRLIETAFGDEVVPEAAAAAQQVLQALGSRLHQELKQKKRKKKAKTRWDLDSRAHLESALQKIGEALSTGSSPRRKITLVLKASEEDKSK